MNDLADVTCLDAARCVCDRGPVAVAVFQRGTSVLVRRIGDMGHHTAADWRCIDCVADAAEEVARNPRRPWHPNFGGPGMTRHETETSTDAACAAGNEEQR